MSEPQTILQPASVAVLPKRKANGAAGPVRSRSSVFTLADLRGEDTQTLFEWNGRRLRVSYNPNAMTIKDHRVIREMTANEDPENPSGEWLIPSLCRFITGWDLVADPETMEMLPISQETMEQLPSRFLIGLIRHIQEEINPPEPATS
jgi:hypothetical protein